jgi:hypothetical protein
MLQLFYSFETDYARAVTRWHNVSQDVRLDGLMRWMTGSAATILWYPTWMDESSPTCGDDGYQSVSDGSNGSLYVYAVVGEPVGSVVRHRAIFLPPGSPAPPLPPVAPPTPFDCAKFIVSGAGLGDANGVYDRLPTNDGAGPARFQQVRLFYAHTRTCSLAHFHTLHTHTHTHTHTHKHKSFSGGRASSDCIHPESTLERCGIKRKPLGAGSAWTECNVRHP